MPRCFPPTPSFGGRHGERAAWEALRDGLPDEAVLFAHRWFADGGRQQEVDLLVAWPGVGLAAVEVKGGRVERDARDRWWSVRGSDRHEVGNPMVQAADARHALCRFLQAQRAGAAAARSQHLVCLPHMTFPRSYDPPDFPRAQVVDCVDLPDIAARLRTAVERGGGHAVLDAAQTEELVGLLVQATPPHPSERVAAEEHEQLVRQKTEDQARTVRALKAFPRLSVVGGAGTGKTWLALEQARRLCDDGQRVAMVCYSRGLGRFLQRETASWRRRPAYVGLFHDLAQAWGAPPAPGDETSWYEAELPAALHRLAAQRPAEQRFHALVVDEAQDVGAAWWPALLACLADPDTGGLSVFSDPAQGVFGRHGRPPVELPPYTLYENLRNTKRIAQVFGSLTSERETFSAFPGPRVRFVRCHTGDAVERADAAVEALLDEWEPGRVALLTTLHRHPAHAQAVDHRGWAAYWDEVLAGEGVCYGHVLGFKGLERPAVVLAVDGFRQPEQARQMLYVGLSRARTQLVVCGDLDEIARVGGGGVHKRLADAEPWQP